MAILFIRHGETDLNAARVIQMPAPPFQHSASSKRSGLANDCRLLALAGAWRAITPARMQRRKL